MGIIFAILIFSFIVFFHELGHFTLAKLNGIDVQEFAIGMGPTLFSKEYKGTVYAVHLLPIGGFCAMGEDDEETESPGNFNKKSVWARISVIAAGPIFNFIMAVRRKIPSKASLSVQEFPWLRQVRCLTLLWHLFSL